MAICTVNLSTDSVSGISLGAIACSDVSVNSPLSTSFNFFLRFKILRYTTPTMQATRNPTVAIVRPKLFPPTSPEFSYTEPKFSACPGPCPKPSGNKSPAAGISSAMASESRMVIIMPTMP